MSKKNEPAPFTKPNVMSSVSKAKQIIANIYTLTGKHKGGADWDLEKATDAMYKFIETIEKL